MLLNDLQSGCSCINSVSTQVLASALGRAGSFDRNGIEHSLELRNIMSIGSGHDERQRDAGDAFKYQAGVFGFAPAAGLAGIGLICNALAHRDQ